MALATPVPVLTVSDGRSEFVGALAPDEPLLYSYRQSIYQVTVYEELARMDGEMRIQRARSPDSVSRAREHTSGHHSREEIVWRVLLAKKNMSELRWTDT